jgi:hypothetical protein
MLKPKGRAKQALPSKDIDKFEEIVKKSLELDVNLGFDSCSAPLVLRALDNDLANTMIEPCEAFLFSSYANVKGEFFPCSFCEGEEGWENGIELTSNSNFIDNIWNHPRMVTWREKLIDSSTECNCKHNDLCRSCPVFEITPCKNIHTQKPTERRDWNQESKVAGVLTATCN